MNAPVLTPLAPEAFAPDPAEPPTPPRRGHALRRGLARAFSPGWVRAGVLGTALLASAGAGVYWQVLASDRYVSEAHVLVQSTAGATLDPGALGGLIGGLAGPGPSQADQLLLRDHLLSVDTALKLDAQLHLRRHFAAGSIDWLSRLDPDASDDALVGYLQQRISVTWDDGGGVLVIDAQAFEPHLAQAVVAAMITEGEAFMNDNAHRLARAQVDFLEGEVARTDARTRKARAAMLAFQDQSGLVDPVATIGSVAGTVSSLEATRAQLDAQVKAAEAYLVPDHPTVVALRQQRDAVDAELAAQKQRLAGGVAGTAGKPLNATAERYARLAEDAGFAQQLYQSTLAALEKGRIDAMRKVKLISVVQAPNLPSDPGAPDRTGNALVFALVALLAAGLSLLGIAIMRDHVA